MVALEGLWKTGWVLFALSESPTFLYHLGIREVNDPSCEKPFLHYLTAAHESLRSEASVPLLFALYDDILLVGGTYPSHHSQSQVSFFGIKRTSVTVC